MYVVIDRFKEDLGAGEHIYQVGEAYPKEGSKKPTAKRLKLLSTENNKYNKPFIKKVEEEV